MQDSAGSLQHRAGRVTLDDLAALNREIAVLVRAGLPLEAGLRRPADDFGGGAGRLAASLAEQTAAGRSLAEAVAAHGDALPPVYRAVVEAGLKSGRLSAALEAFADTAARVAELRRIAAQAAIYPIIVVSLAWMLLVFITSQVMPQYEWLHFGNRVWTPTLTGIDGRSLWLLALSVPAGLLAVAAIAWRKSGRAGGVAGPARYVRWIPGVGRAVLLSEQANFADLLALLLAYRVPLEEALPLAARASGARGLEAPADELAAQIAAGHPLTRQVAALRQLPPLVRTAFLNGAVDQSLLAGVRRAASVYRDRAAGWVGDVAIMLPVAVTLALGLGVVAIYCFLVLQPYAALMMDIFTW